MPYTLTSLGEYLARQRQRRWISLSTALVVPEHCANQSAVERWTESLEATHPLLHASGQRAVALVTDAQFAAVVPFAWVPRLPLKKPPTLKPLPVVPGNALPFEVVPQGQSPASIRRIYRQSGVPVSAQSMRATYEVYRDRLAWWEGAYPGYHVGSYEKRLGVTSELHQMKPTWNAGSRLVRKLDTTQGTPWANEAGREYYDALGSPLWLDEDVFRVFARDREDFDQHFVLLSLTRYRTLAVVEHASRLVVGLVNTALDGARINYEA